MAIENFKSKSQKRVFLQALIITLVVFNFGIFMGYMLESSRTSKVDSLYLQAEMELLDQRIIKDASDILDLDCDLMIEENIKFADKIFEEAQEIQRYEKAARLTEDFIFQHKRYDLLRTLFWINSIRIKEKCGASYHNLVYFYKYNEPSLEQKGKQDFFSNLLFEIKKEKAGDVMLIPIAADNDLPAINLLLEKYEIDLENLPIILIDEEYKVSEIETIEDVMKYLD